MGISYNWLSPINYNVRSNSQSLYKERFLITTSFLLLPRDPLIKIMSRVRNFVFTWNNYPDDHDDQLKLLTVKYILYGKEISKTGTPHLQGTIVFHTLKSEKQVRKLMPGCHIEPCADLFASITYCKKDKDWTEHGTSPKTKTQIGELEQERWKNILQAAEDGRIDDIPYKIRFNQPSRS